MRRDVMHYFNADVATVYQAYLTAAQNPPFSRTCEQKPYYSFQFGLNFSMKYNMNGGSCTLHFIPHGAGTAVDLRFSVVQLAGGRYAAYDRDLTNKAIDLLRVPAQPLKISVEEFLDPKNWVTAASGASPKELTPPEPQSAPAPQPIPVPQPAPAPQPDPAPQLIPAPQPAPAPQPIPAPQPAPVPPVPTDRLCTKCGTQLLPGARFCTGCGTPIQTAQICSSCGNFLLPGAMFCTFCGKKQV